jgi:hypothetical protein
MASQSVLCSVLCQCCPREMASHSCFVFSLAGQHFSCVLIGDCSPSCSFVLCSVSLVSTPTATRLFCVLSCQRCLHVMDPTHLFCVLSRLCQHCEMASHSPVVFSLTGVNTVHHSSVLCSVNTVHVRWHILCSVLLVSTLSTCAY